VKPKNLYRAPSNINSVSDEFTEKENRVLEWISSQDFKDWLSKESHKSQGLCGTDLHLYFTNPLFGCIGVYNYNEYLGPIYYTENTKAISHELKCSLFWSRFVASIEFEEEA